MGHLPTTSDATHTLLQQATLCSQGRQPTPGQIDGQVTSWRWSPEKRCCVAGRCAVEDALRATAARWARDAAAISPDDDQARRLHLLTMLEAAAYERGLDEPLDDQDPALREAASCGVARLNEVLELALTKRAVGAARAAAHLLGQTGNAQEALRTGPRAAPLVRAVRDGDRRVRMEALEAIARLKPAAAYPGSSQVVESLAFLAATSGVRRALVAGPEAAGLREMAESLSLMGYQTDVATTGRQALRMALASPDYEVVFLDTTLDDPVIELLVQQFRRDGRTAALRIGVLARDGSLEKARRIAREDALCLAFSRPHTPEALRWQMGQLATLAPREFVGFEVRQAEAARAWSVWPRWPARRRNYYDLARVQDSLLAALLRAEACRAGRGGAGLCGHARGPAGTGRVGQPL